MKLIQMIDVIDELRNGGAKRYSDFADALEKDLHDHYTAEEIKQAEDELSLNTYSTIDMTIIDAFIEEADRLDQQRKDFLKTKLNEGEEK